MATAGRFSALTRELLIHVPEGFKRLIYQIAEGKNPNVQFPFHELKVIRGTVPHPPHTDLEEVRNSITVQFNGVPGGPVVAHLFNDGTIRTSAQMHEKNNQTKAQEQQLIAEENRFPTLQQTAARKQAKTKMMERIQAARCNQSWSIIQKQLEKDSATQEYNLVLMAQAQARTAAAAGENVGASMN